MTNPKLTILSEVLRGQTFELSKDIYTIGRSEDKDITIVDPTVSGLHAILSRKADGSYSVKDNGSTNGTRINGVIITEQDLSSSDILQVGGVEIMYEFGAAAGSSVAVPNNTTQNIKLDGEKTVINTQMGPLAPNSTRSKSDSSAGVTMAMKIIIGLLTLVVLGLLGVVVYSMMFSA